MHNIAQISSQTRDMLIITSTLRPWEVPSKSVDLYGTIIDSLPPVVFLLLHSRLRVGKLWKMNRGIRCGEIFGTFSMWILIMKVDILTCHDCHGCALFLPLGLEGLARRVFNNPQLISSEPQLANLPSGIDYFLVA